jgi:hypothetical protein
VFPAQRGGKLSNMAMSMLLRRMGVEAITDHGFRSKFRDWAGVETDFERETVDRRWRTRSGIRQSTPIGAGAH